ncbi:MAG: hypothetical protein R3F65_10240 [bacterium]
MAPAHRCHHHPHPHRPAAADWPMQAHDPQRTATSPGRADLADPIVTWSYSLGAEIDTRQIAFADIDRDDTYEAITIDGSEVIARRADGGVIWSTPSMAPSRSTASSTSTATAPTSSS